ncbi:MAG: hypothetical protein E7378_03160 [Clostridiales bacterium]|nr:hypothetical protein [Clostridiales bacterium]
MGKYEIIGKFVFVLLMFGILISGIYTAPFVIEYIMAKSEVTGEPTNATYTEIPEEFKDYYTITYNLNGGTLEKENPTKYNLFTVDFTLNNPTIDDMEFVGWTWEGQSEPVKNLVIKQGSSGDVEFTANYAKVLLLTPTFAEVTEYQINWTYPEEVDGCELVINDHVIELQHPTTFVRCSDYLEYFMDVDVHTVKLRTFVDYSRRYYSDYAVTTLDNGGKPIKP